MLDKPILHVAEAIHDGRAILAESDVRGAFAPATPVRKRARADAEHECGLSGIDEKDGVRIVGNHKIPPGNRHNRNSGVHPGQKALPSDAIRTSALPDMRESAKPNLRVPRADLQRSFDLAQPEQGFGASDMAWGGSVSPRQPLKASWETPPVSSG